MRLTDILRVSMVLMTLGSAVLAQWEEHECEEYGDEVNVFNNSEGFDMYGGSGSVVLHFRRELLEETTNSVTRTIRGQEIAADTLDEDLTVELTLSSSAPRYSSEELVYPTLEGWQAEETDPRILVEDVPSYERLRYDDVYPGINFGHYEDQDQWEFDFVARRGSTWEDISLSLDAAETPQVDQYGNLVFYLECAKLVLQRPVVYQSRDGEETQRLEGFLGNYSGGGSRFGIDFTPLANQDDLEPYAGTELHALPELRIVSASSGTNGPPYDFHVSTYETTNGEWVDFLNSAQANSTNLLGTNMFFDAYGNVWINPEMRTRRDELFSIADGRLVYDATQPVGKRYRMTTRSSKYSESYTNHPATGISWYGAVKYCNWLTLSTGRGADQLCYREGTNTWDWVPITCAETNWLEGTFTHAERAAWLGLDGFRMLMDDSSSTNSEAGIFNEFYKAATWGGKTNALYGYGRNEVQPGDANFRQTPSTDKPDTLEVGFFDGSDHDGRYPTRANQNLYGIYDLSGNVSEWVTDVGITNSSLTRAEYGGSWMQRPPAMNERTVTRPYETSTARGFRVSTMDSGEDLFLIRIPYYACLCKYQKRLDEKTEGVGEKEAAEEREYNVLTVDTEGVGDIGGILPKEKGAGEGESEGGGEGGGGGGGGGEPGDIVPEEETTVEL